jgi:cytochrome P450
VSARSPGYLFLTNQRQAAVIMESVEDDIATPIPGPAPDVLMGARKAVTAFAKDPLHVAESIYTKYGPFAGIVSTEDARKVPPMLFALGPDIFPEINDVAGYSPGAARLYPTLGGDSALATVAVENLRFVSRPELLERAMDAAVIEQLLRNAMPSMPAIVDQWERDFAAEPFDAAAEFRRIARPLALNAVFGFAADDEPARIADALHAVQADGFRLSAGSALERLMGGGKAVKVASRILNELVTHAHYAVGEPNLVGALAGARADDGGQFTDDDMRAILAGVYPAIETALWSIPTWASILISQQTMLLAKIQDELYTVTKGNRIEAEHVGQLTVLDQVVRETMRLFPVCPIGSRLTAGEVTLGDWTLAAGTLLVHSPFVTHRDAAVYDKPVRFLPHRFEAYKPTGSEWLPFGDLEPVSEIVVALVKLVLGALFQRFRLTMLRGQTIDHAGPLSLVPAGPVPMYMVGPGLIYPVSTVSGTIHAFVELPKAK